MPCPAQPAPGIDTQLSCEGSRFESAHRRPFFIETEVDPVDLIMRPAKVSISPNDRAKNNLEINMLSPVTLQLVEFEPAAIESN